MGQKVNPHGIRVGVIKDWDSRWFASKKDFSDNLVEDHKIRTELKAQLKDAGVPKIEIERTVDPSTSAPRVTVNIYCAKPGMVIGKGGEERVALQNKLARPLSSMSSRSRALLPTLSWLLRTSLVSWRTA